MTAIDQMDIVRLLQRQKELGDGIRRKADHFNGIPAERRKYPDLVERVNEIKAAMEEFNANNQILTKSTTIESNHDYFESLYYSKLHDVYVAYAKELTNVIGIMEASNPDLKRTSVRDLGGNEEEMQISKGTPVNLVSFSNQMI